MSSQLRNALKWNNLAGYCRAKTRAIQGISSNVLSWCKNFRTSISRHGNTKNTVAKFTKTQHNAYFAGRVKRLRKLYTMYHQAYNDNANTVLFQPIIRRFFSARGIPFALGACGFKWHEDGISDDEMKRQIHTWIDLEEAVNKQNEIKNDIIPEYWENVLNEENVKMWKYPSKETGLMEYKIFATFNDITPRNFFNLQIDMEYRKQWDDLVLKVEVLDEDKSRNEQVLQWVTRFSYPMSPREYLCVRRTMVDEKNKIMVISARSVSHPKCQPCSKYVRVTSYFSDIVIKPHKGFDDLGFDYVMSYSDDPQTVFPNRLTSWVISQGIPDYIEKLHKACLNMNNSSNLPKDSSIVRVPYEFNQN